ncbi:MAG: hypothetical protein WDO14_13810 [Bacteroidota bacterium]
MKQQLVVILILLFSCTSKNKEQTQDCTSYFTQGNQILESVLWGESETRLPEALYMANKALTCNPSSVRNIWLKIRVASRMKQYDTALAVTKKAILLHEDPAFHRVAASLYGEKGYIDSARMELHKAADKYDEWIADDSIRETGFIVAKIEIMILLEGKKKAFREAERYQEMYPDKTELKDLNLVLDSIL